MPRYRSRIKARYLRSELASHESHAQTGHRHTTTLHAGERSPSFEITNLKIFFSMTSLSDTPADRRSTHQPDDDLVLIDF
jgi:hypothetical protein